jgi:hypothetical protein
LCLGNHPPFDKSSDKGFKDAYIYLTILDYLLPLTDEKAFLISRDGRLKEAFDENDQIKVVENFDEFEKYLDTYFKEPYFISRLKEEISDEITKEDIKDSWLNSNENWVLKLVVWDKTYFIEVDFYALTAEISFSWNLLLRRKERRDFIEIHVHLISVHAMDERVQKFILAILKSLINMGHELGLHHDAGFAVHDVEDAVVADAEPVHAWLTLEALDVCAGAASKGVLGQWHGAGLEPVTEVGL